VHAPDAAGRDDADTGPVRDEHGGRDRRRSPPAGDEICREVAQIQLDRAAAGGELRKLLTLQADAYSSVDDADRRGVGALGSNGCLQSGADFDSLRMWKAVGDQRRLERNDRAVRPDRCCNRLRYNDVSGSAHSAQRAAARLAFGPDTPIPPS
jgi:hypothetical protein